MKQSKLDHLTGLDNARLDTVDATNSEGTAAWSNSEQIKKISHVTKPAEYEVVKSKNWVDNGSQL